MFPLHTHRHESITSLAAASNAVSAAGPNCRCYNSAVNKTFLSRPIPRLDTTHTDAEAPTFHFEYRGTRVACPGL